MNSKREKIAAVVVTYNRLPLLKECVESLRKQTRKLDEIIIVNNDSTDGTKEWLDDQKDLTVIHQENLGGAGGFHNGMKHAYEKDHDWIWLMDDDGLPAKNALENLLNFSNENVGVLNSLVISKHDINKLAFGLFNYFSNKYFREVNEIGDDKIVYGANFFNGTLISQNTIEIIGLPEPLFFIYGDDTEYYFRIRHSNIKIITIMDSIIKHPVQKQKFIGKWKFFYRMHEFNLLDVKYFPRNILAICILYDEFTCRRLLKHYSYDLLGLLLWQKNIKYVVLYLKSVFKGLSFYRRIKKNYS